MESLSSFLGFHAIAMAVCFIFVIRAGYQITLIYRGKPEVSETASFWLRSVVLWVVFATATTIPNWVGVAVMATFCAYVSLQFTAKEGEDVNEGDIADVKSIAAKMVLPLILPATFGVISALVNGEFALSTFVPNHFAKIYPLIAPIILSLAARQILKVTTAINRSDNSFLDLLKRF